MKRKQKSIKKLLASMGLTLALAVSLAGCGKEKAKEEAGAVPSGFYKAEYVELPLETQDSYVNRSEFANGRIYYLEESYAEDKVRAWLKFRGTGTDAGTDAGTVSVPIELGERMSVAALAVDGENNIFLGIMDSSQVVYSEATGETSGSEKYLLHKLDDKGTLILEKEITSLLKGDGESYIYLQEMCTDTKGNLYLMTEGAVLLLDGEGNEAGRVSLEGWANSIGRGPDGAVYVSLWGDQGGMKLAAIDFDKKALDAARTYTDIPGNGGNGAWGLDLSGNFLLYDSVRLYRYTAGAEESETILDWIDSDMSGSNISNVEELEEGRLGVVLNSWGEASSKTELVILTRAEAGELAQKEIITLGVLSQGNVFQNQIIQFNRSSDKYKIRVKYYIDSNAQWTETTYLDGMKAMSADILSGNGADFFSVDGLDIGSLSAKGAFEDLYPYLDASDDISREDILENVLEAYTYQDKLTCIPMSFYVETVAAKTSLVGDRRGWTMDDVIAMTDAHPDAEVMQYASKPTMLQYLLQNSVAEFVDNEKGTCNFHDPEFVKLLEYINRFPAEPDFDYEQEESFVGKLREDRLLLYNIYLGQAESISEVTQIFGGEPVSFPGYPTVDGENGTFISSSGAYAVSARSSHKEGAWEFLHTLLTAESTQEEQYYYGFPVRKKSLEALFAKAQEDIYVLDEEGNVLLDEQGNPVKQSRGGISFGPEDSIEIYAPTDEELALLRDLIERARPKNQMDMQIMTMIAEECEPFFLGQKTADAVADIIQSRVQLYISENR